MKICWGVGGRGLVWFWPAYIHTVNCNWAIRAGIDRTAIINNNAGMYYKRHLSMLRYEANRGAVKVLVRAASQPRLRLFPARNCARSFRRHQGPWSEEH